MSWLMSAALTALGNRAVELDRVARLAGKALVMADRQPRSRDQCHRGLVTTSPDWPLDQDGDVPGIAGEWDPAGAPGEPAVAAQCDPAIGMHRGERQRATRHRNAGAGQQPASHQGLGEWHRDGEPPGRAQHREAVGDRGAGAAEILRDPGDGQPRLLERLP